MNIKITVGQPRHLVELSNILDMAARRATIITVIMSLMLLAMWLSEKSLRVASIKKTTFLELVSGEKRHDNIRKISQTIMPEQFRNRQTQDTTEANSQKNRVADLTSPIKMSTGIRTTTRKRNHRGETITEGNKKESYGEPCRPHPEVERNCWIIALVRQKTSANDYWQKSVYKKKTRRKLTYFSFSHKMPERWHVFSSLGGFFNPQRTSCRNEHNAV